MPRTIRTFDDPGQDREIDYLHKRIDDLVAAQQALRAPVAVSPPRVDLGSGLISVQDETGEDVLQVSGLIFVAADGFSISEQNGLAEIDLSGGSSLTPASTVTDVAATGAVGTSLHYAREDHVHQGVHSLAEHAGTPLHGDVTIAATSPISVSQASQEITLAHAASGVTAGSYTSADITVDADGHVTAAATGGGGGCQAAGELTTGDTAAAALFYLHIQAAGTILASFGLPPTILALGHAAICFYYTFINVSASSFTILPNGSETINGAASLTCAAGAKIVLCSVAGPNCDGNWVRLV